MPEHEVPRKSEEELREFIRKVLGNEIFTSDHLSESEKKDIGMVFMPVALGVFNNWTKEEIAKIGVLYEENRRRGPRSINGLPMFTSFTMLHTEDWEKARKVIMREQERMKNLSLEE